MSHPRWTITVLLLGGVGLGVRAAAPPPGPVEHLWAELGTADPVQADRVMARLVARPAQTVSLLRRHLRPVAVDPAWLACDGGAVPRVARAIYEDRRFDGMPILADALEEAGCSDPDIMAHCREPREHVRGCWVVDHLLKKV